MNRYDVPDKDDVDGLNDLLYCHEEPIGEHDHRERRFHDGTDYDDARKGNHDDDIDCPNATAGYDERKL